ncbi:MAG: OmpA family protein [Bacteroidetes bacterium]|jgi:outer membrane protein OmpA-like peptidoglycan-associated protein|nr:OmpA family protein [Bacteroidota bacterium]
MTKSTSSCLLIGLFFNIILSTAQITQFEPQDFELSGQTVRLGNNCFRLTPDREWSSGSIWNKKSIDLKNSFEMEIDVRLGCKDNDGADGIVFMFYPYTKRTGHQGEGMGFGGLKPSLGIELDTWRNEHLGDPWYDHLAILANGEVSHYWNLTEPVPIKSNKENVEDCRKHRLKVVWEANLKTLTIWFDGESRMKLKKDLVQHIFRGNSKVYWGFSAATGGSNNIHEICLEKLEITEVEYKEFDFATSMQLINGDCLDLENVAFDAGKTTLKPISKKQLDKLVAFLKFNSEHKLSLYAHTDSIGSESANKSISKKRAGTIKKYLVSKGIKENRIAAHGMGEKYPVTSNSSEAGRKQNRRVEICVSKPRA